MHPRYLSLSPLCYLSDTPEHRRRLNLRRMIAKLCLHATRGVPFIRAVFANQFHVQRRVARKLCRRYASRFSCRWQPKVWPKTYIYIVLGESRVYGNTWREYAGWWAHKDVRVSWPRYRERGLENAMHHNHRAYKVSQIFIRSRQFWFFFHIKDFINIIFSNISLYFLRVRIFTITKIKIKILLKDF